MLGRGGVWASAPAIGGNKYVRSTRFAIINSGTSGSLALPSNSTVVLDDFGGTVDAVVTQVSGGKPTKLPALTAAGAVVATTFDASGNWAFTGTPSAYPVAIVYRVQQLLGNFDSTSSDIWGDAENQGASLAAGVYSMASGTDTFSVTYAAAIAAAIPPNITFVNSVDGSPIFLQGMITAFSTTGFTVKTNALTDSSNYKMVYDVKVA